MNNAWYDKLHPEQTRKRDILALTTGFFSLGVLAPPFVEYRRDKVCIIRLLIGTEQCLNLSFSRSGFSEMRHRKQSRFCLSRYTLHKDFLCRLRSNGVNYCDAYRLSQPQYVKVPWINKYFHRFANFHRSLLMKYCYHLVSSSNSSHRHLDERIVALCSFVDLLPVLPPAVLVCSVVQIQHSDK